MKAYWPIVFGLICLAQIVILTWAIYTPGLSLLTGDITVALQLAIYGLSASLPIFTGSLLTNNFPDKMITGKQKRNFNIITSVNLLLIPFMVSFVLSEYKQTPALTEMAETRFISQRFFSALELMLSVGVLTVHLGILFGLYFLRDVINSNARNKQSTGSPGNIDR